MTIEKTLTFIKPDATKKRHIGEILARYEKNGLRIVALKMLHLSKARADEFYAVHKERPFFQDLTSFVSSGPIVAVVLEGKNAIAKTREVMGATNPSDAAPGTIRADFAASIDENAVHGSDATETAEVEIPFFFDIQEIVG